MALGLPFAKVNKRRMPEGLIPLNRDAVLKWFNRFATYLGIYVIFPA
jgi:hypothetical protein